MKRRGPAVLGRRLLLAIAAPLVVVGGAGTAAMADHVFVPCAGAPEVDRFALDGTLIRLSLPQSTYRCVAAEGSGTAWISDAGFAVWRIDSDGTVVAKVSAPATVSSIAVDCDGALWAAMGSGSPSIVRYDKSGSITANASGLKLPSSIAIDGRNRAWVADAGSNNVFRFSPRGILELTFRVEGCPREVAIDRSGDVWIGAQCPQPRLFKFREDGTPVFDVAIPGSILGSIAVDRRGDVWVAMPLTQAIHRFGADGSLAESHVGITGATSIGIDGEGKLWITGDAASVVTRFDPDLGRVLFTESTGAGPRGRGDMTGFTRALVVEPEGDFDRDGYANAAEIDAGSNPFSAGSIPFAWLAGNVNSGAGATQDVLFVNDTAGLPGREVTLLSWEPVVVFVNAPLLAPGPVPFALYAMPGISVAETSPVAQPFGIGDCAFQTPLSGGFPQPRVLVNSLRSRRGPSAGEPVASGPLAPGIVRMYAAGFGRPYRVVLQGVIADPGSAGPGLSVTNAIGVVIR